MDREDLSRMVEEKFGIASEYPWNDDSLVFRHPEKRKLFGVVMKVRGEKLGIPDEEYVDLLNVKLDPIIVGSLIGQEGYLPAWHVNRRHWISIRLGDHVPAGDIEGWLDMSFHLTE